MENITREVARAARFGIAVQRKAGPHRTDPFFEELLAGMEVALDSHGATVFLRQFGTYEEELAAYPLWAATDLVDAVVVVDSPDDDPRPRLCLELGLPVVVLGGQGAEGASLVDVDNSGAMEMAVDYLANLGHQTIGRVSGPAHLHHTKARSAAFEQALLQRSLAGLSLEGDYSAESGASRTREILMEGHPPTAIIYDNGTMAAAGMDAAHELGLEVPGELSLLAWDDGPHCRLAAPPLSVVSLDVYELGRIVAEVLMKTRAGALQTIVHVPVGSIVTRGSTGRPPGAGSADHGTEPAAAP